MNSEHRHELQRNDLGELTLKAKPWLEKHGLQWLAGIVVVLIVVGIGLYVANQPKADAAGWGRLSSAQSVDDFGAVAEKYSDSLAGVWARCRMAELNLESGLQALFTDRELGLKDVKKAQEDFEAVINSKLTVPDSIKQRALLGLARCQEAASDGDVSAALATYRKLLEYQGSMYEPHVKQRVKDLETGGAKDFYAWFHSQKPKPPDFRKPSDGTPQLPGMPGGTSLPGEVPDVSLPPKPTTPATSTATPAKEEPKADAPPTDSKPEDAAKPDAAKPDAPADKPAEEKPTTP